MDLPFLLQLCVIYRPQSSLGTINQWYLWRYTDLTKDRDPSVVKHSAPFFMLRRSFRIEYGMPHIHTKLSACSVIVRINGVGPL